MSARLVRSVKVFRDIRPWKAAGAALGLAALLSVATRTAPLLHAQIGNEESVPYAGQENSSVPGLSEAEITALRTGAGMGLARPGEINGYPGPRHVLDLADELALTPDQRAAVQALFDQMQREAVALGNDFWFATLPSSNPSAVVQPPSRPSSSRRPSWASSRGSFGRRT
jgi:hypothetical protein